MRPEDIVIAIDDDSADGIKMKEWNGNKSTISKDFDDEDEDKLKKAIRSKIDRMKKRAGDQLKNALNKNSAVLSTPDRKKSKSDAINAIHKYQKAKKEDTCDDLLELTELTVDNPNVFDSEDWNKRFQSLSSPGDH